MDHGQGVVSIFLHLSKIYVKEDGFVRAGQLVGAIDPVAWRYEGVE
jgi:lysostaphin